MKTAKRRQNPNPTEVGARLPETPFSLSLSLPSTDLPTFERRLSAKPTISEMGVKAKKAMKKKLKKGSSQLSAANCKDEYADFLPLEGGPGCKLPKSETLENTAAALYIGRIPHGFYENEMEGFFKQFGSIKRLRIARNKKTGKSKHFGFIEFECPEVAKIVSECMHNYLMFEHILQVHLIPPERVHPKLWKGVNRWYKPLDWVRIERKRHNKERTLEENKKMVEGNLETGPEKAKED
ncbi:RNA recognition motif domain protein [Actinidia chinensis var. chinensis]|uniref:RNA recognition motif domain protein n=1 Tax=Actinidia chinensis var. chinensis TaxID=1590841 RepID=A0A2R6PKW1_ACTCC|nr:RNA recognition motif domain protein [Actinidia chinensis var. chinensis]